MNQQLPSPTASATIASHAGAQSRGSLSEAVSSLHREIAKVIHGLSTTSVQRLRSSASYVRAFPRLAESLIRDCTYDLLKSSRRHLAYRIFPEGRTAVDKALNAIVAIKQTNGTLAADEEHWRKMCDVYADDALAARKENQDLLEKLYDATKPKGWTGTFSSEDALRVIETQKGALKSLYAIRGQRRAAHDSPALLKREEETWAAVAKIADLPAWQASTPVIVLDKKSSAA